MLGVQLADVSTRRSSHPHGKSEARCEMMATYRHGSVRTQRGAEVKVLMQLVLVRLELILPHKFFMVAIQQPGNSYPSSRLSLLLVGVFWICKTSFTLS